MEFRGSPHSGECGCDLGAPACLRLVKHLRWSRLQILDGFFSPLDLCRAVMSQYVEFKRNRAVRSEADEAVMLAFVGAADWGNWFQARCRSRIHRTNSWCSSTL